MPRQLLVGALALVALVGAAEARRLPNRPNLATVTVDKLVDTDDGSLPDDDSRAAFEAQAADAKLGAALVKCSPIGRRFALAFVEVGAKRSRVTVSHPDKKLAACMASALSRLHGDPEWTAVLSVQLAPPPSNDPDRFPKDPLAP